MMPTLDHTPPLHLARPAPDQLDDESADDVESGAPATDNDLHALFEDWAHWATTRRFFSPPPVNTSLLGRLTSKTRPTRAGGPDAQCNAELAALHLAIAAQPLDALDRRVFEMHYRIRVRNIKSAAAVMGIGRQHWYTLLREFRRRCFAASREILQVNQAAARVLKTFE